jgi:hypothetical protein
MISLVLALRALETCGPKLIRNGTVWKYLERDMPEFRKTMKIILNEDDSEEKINELFLLLNTIDMLAMNLLNLYEKNKNSLKEPLRFHLD